MPPDRVTFTHGFSGLYPGSIEDHDGFFGKARPKTFKLLDDKVACEALCAGLKQQRIVAAEEPEAVEPGPLTGGHPHRFILELPGIRRDRVSRDPALVSVVEVS